MTAAQTAYALAYEARRGRRTDPLRVQGGCHLGPTHRNPTARAPNTQAPRTK